MNARIIGLLYQLPWYARRRILLDIGVQTTFRLSKCCRQLRQFIITDERLWQIFYERDFLHDYPAIEQAYFEWCCSSIDDTKLDMLSYMNEFTFKIPNSVLSFNKYLDDLPNASLHRYQTTSMHHSTEYDAFKHNNFYAQTAAARKQETQAKTVRTVRWYEAYRRRARTGERWRLGVYKHYSVSLPVAESLQQEAIWPHIVAASPAGVLVQYGNALFSVLLSSSPQQDDPIPVELDLETETLGILQIRRAWMTERWVAVELYDEQLPEAGGVLSVWRLGDRYSQHAFELEEGGEHVHDVRGRWTVLALPQQRVTRFTLIDLGTGQHCPGELRVGSQSAELIRVNETEAFLLVVEKPAQSQHSDSQTGSFHPPNLSTTNNNAYTNNVSTAASDSVTDTGHVSHEVDHTNISDISSTTSSVDDVMVGASTYGNTTITSPVIGPTFANSDGQDMATQHTSFADTTHGLAWPQTGTGQAQQVSTITCNIYRFSLDSPPTLISTVHIPIPPRLMLSSLRVRVLDERRLLLEYMETGSFIVRVKVYMLPANSLPTDPRRSWRQQDPSHFPLETSVAQSNESISQSGIHTVESDNTSNLKQVAVISWYKRRPVLIRGCEAEFVDTTNYEVGAGYSASPTLENIALLFHDDYMEGEATLMDMITWRPLSNLGYWRPALGPNWITSTFIARVREGSMPLDIWCFAVS